MARGIKLSDLDSETLARVDALDEFMGRPRAGSAKAIERAKRSAAALASRERGQRAEDAFAACHDASAALGYGRMFKRPVETKIVGKDRRGRPRIVPEKKAGVDYFGYLFGGRCVLAEAKCTAHGALRLSEVDAVQRAQLDAGVRSGVLCLLLVAFEHGSELSLYVVAWTWIRNRASVTQLDLEPHRIDAAEPYLARYR